MLEGRGNELLACVHLLLGLFHNTVPWWGESSYAESRDEVVWLKARDVCRLQRAQRLCGAKANSTIAPRNLTGKNGKNGKRVPP